MKTQIRDTWSLEALAARNIVQKTYWLSQLENMVRCTLPYDFDVTGCEETGTHPGEIPIPISAGDSERLNRLSLRDDRRLNTILVSAVVVFLYKLTGMNDIVIGTPVFRGEDGIEELLPLRLRFLPEMRFSVLLHHVREIINEAMKNRDFPISLLPRYLSGDPKLACPLFDVVTQLRNIHHLVEGDEYNHSITFDFERKNETVSGKISGKIIYNTQRFGKKSIETLAQRFSHLLGQLLEDPEMEFSQVKKR